VNHQYVWFLWASAFLLPWVFLYWRFSAYRRVMLLASFATMPFGLTEPLFVPEYWSPPSLFNLASRTGFDIESLIFCFAIGGIGVVLYSALTGKGFSRVSIEYRRLPLHRYHGLASATPFIVFPLLWLLPWNPIYPAITAMAAGAIANILCRPELKQKTWVGGLLFLALYAVFIGGLELFMPSYIDEVWNIEGLSGIMFLRVPIEEYLFAFGFGIYWAGVYEHFTWRRPAAEERRAPVLESHSRHDREVLENGQTAQSQEAMP
jgi:hypothetical protein